jgi:hypothetical protein
VHLREACLSEGHAKQRTGSQMRIQTPGKEQTGINDRKAMLPLPPQHTASQRDLSEAKHNPKKGTTTPAQQQGTRGPPPRARRGRLPFSHGEEEMRLLGGPGEVLCFQGRGNALFGMPPKLGAARGAVLGAKKPPRETPACKRVTGTRCVVDAFTSQSPLHSAYFLTHFHSDHYGGLRSSYKQPSPICKRASGCKRCSVC